MRRGTQRVDWCQWPEGQQAEHTYNSDRVRCQNFLRRHNSEIRDINKDVTERHDGNAIDDCQGQVSALRVFGCVRFACARKSNCGGGGGGNDNDVGFRSWALEVAAFRKVV